MKSLLTVCIGNICRSPMAEGLLSAGLPELNVISAGIGALIGKPADVNAQKIMRRKGFDISGHIARQVTQALCAKADIILVMDSEQLRFLEGRYPSTRGKVFRIAEALQKDVPDPYQQNELAFENAFELIEKGANVWIEKIKKIRNKERQLI